MLVAYESKRNRLPPQEADPTRLLELWRSHWGIENRVFWVRDVTMDEDRSQVRSVQLRK